MPRQPTCLCGVCPKCKKRDQMRRWYQSKTPEERRAWVARRDAERVRAADRARYERDKPKRLQAMRRYVDGLDEEGQRKRAARIAANNALRRGTLLRAPCECAGPDCRGRIQMHHDDYDRPLDVRWLCSRHHGELRRRVPVSMVEVRTDG